MNLMDDFTGMEPVRVPNVFTAVASQMEAGCMDFAQMVTSSGCPLSCNMGGTSKASSSEETGGLDTLLNGESTFGNGNKSTLNPNEELQCHGDGDNQF